MTIQDAIRFDPAHVIPGEIHSPGFSCVACSRVPRSAFLWYQNLCPHKLLGPYCVMCLEAAFRNYNVIGADQEIIALSVDFNNVRGLMTEECEHSSDLGDLDEGREDETEEGD